MEFIYRIPNLLSEEFCRDVIEQFEKSNLKGPGHSYTLKDGYVKASTESNSKISTDISIYPTFVKDAAEVGEPEWNRLIGHINLKLEIGINEYIEKFPMLNKLQKFILEGYNIQRYLPGEGFYNWHC